MIKSDQSLLKYKSNKRLIAVKLPITLLRCTVQYILFHDIS